MPTEAARLSLGRKIGAGGEAEVFCVSGSPWTVYKRYREHRPERDRKLRVMVAHPPALSDLSAAAQLAWPAELITDAGGHVCGVLMPRVDLSTSVPMFQLYNPASRQTVAPGFNWLYLWRTAQNLAALVSAVNRAGYVIGDLNESNLLVSHRAVVALVDCDSMQISDPDSGEVFACPVAKPEYLAPELCNVDLARVHRTTRSDDFALAVLVCLLLTEGVHPFAGTWHGRGEPPPYATRIQRRWFPYRPLSRWRRLRPPPGAVGMQVLPFRLRRLARRAFGSQFRRPTAADWLAALETLEGRLRPCRRSPHHQSARRLRCPWCRRIRAGYPDPFPGPGRTAIQLGPSATARILSFGRRSARSRPVAAVVAHTAAWARRHEPRALAGVVVAAIASLFPIVAVPLALAAIPIVASRRRGQTLATAYRGASRTLPWASGAAAAAVLSGVVVHRLWSSMPAPNALRVGAGVGVAAYALLHDVAPSRVPARWRRVLWTAAAGVVVAAIVLSPDLWPLGGVLAGIY